LQTLLAHGYRPPPSVQQSVDQIACACQPEQLETAAEEPEATLVKVGGRWALKPPVREHARPDSEQCQATQRRQSTKRQQAEHELDALFANPHSSFVLESLGGGATAARAAEEAARKKLLQSRRS
jgi:hypothetical protein